MGIGTIITINRCYCHYYYNIHFLLYNPTAATIIQTFSVSHLNQNINSRRAGLFYLTHYCIPNTPVLVQYFPTEASHHGMFFKETNVNLIAPLLEYSSGSSQLSGKCSNSKNKVHWRWTLPPSPVSFHSPHGSLPGAVLYSHLEPFCLQFVLSFKQFKAPPLRSLSNLSRQACCSCHFFLSCHFSHTVGLCAMLTILSPLKKFLERGECLWFAFCSQYLSSPQLKPGKSSKSV